ncbi:MAG: FtsX-like permease family protein [bacterium]
MSTFRLAMRNARRSMKRSLLTALAIAMAVAAVTFFKAYLTGIFQSFNDTTIRLETGQVKVMPAKAVGRIRSIALEDGIRNVGELVKQLEAIDGVQQVSPRIPFGVLLDKPKGAMPAAGMAHDMSRETHLMELGSMVIEGRLPEDNASETLIGYRLADEMGLKLGDELFVVATTSYGGLGPGLYKIVGLMDTGIPTLDRKFFHIPLSEGQFQLAMDDMAMDIAISLDDGAEAAETMTSIIQQALNDAGRSDLIALTWRQASLMAGAMDPAEKMSSVLMMLIGIVALTTVINTVLMSVMERIREFGALRALGFTRGRITRIVLLETLLLGLIGTAVGIGVGMGISEWLHIVGIDVTTAMENINMIFQPIVRPVPSIQIAIYAAFFGALVSILAAWYPARVAVRINPATALRSQ